MIRRSSRLISLIVLALGAAQALADGGPLFDAPMLSVIGQEPLGMASGDLHEDGDIDLVVANGGDPAKLFVLTNRGGGRFLPPEPIDIGADRYSRNAAIADVTGDGRQDIIVFMLESLGVLPGEPGGGFGPMIESPVDCFGGWADVTDMETPDLNGDGIPDVVLCMEETSIHVLFGNGSGDFESQVTYLIGNANSEGMVDAAAGDLDADGDTDLAICTVGWGDPGASILVLLNDGGGVLQGPTRYPMDYSMDSVCLADMDGDGVLDVVTNSNDRVAILTGVGDGTLAAPAFYDAGTTMDALGCGDLNGDSYPDVVADKDNVLAVLLNAGDGSLLAPSHIRRQAYLETKDMLLEDLDGDSDLDIAVLRWSGDHILNQGGVTMHLNAGDGTMVTSPRFDIGDLGQGFAAADFDNHMGADVVAGHRQTDQMAVVLSDGSGGFSAPYVRPALGEVAGLATGDFNQDGWPDIAAVHRDTDQVAVLQNLGNGNAFPGTAYDTGIEPQGIAVADVDVDGDPDLIIDDSSPQLLLPGRISVLRNQGDGTFAAREISELNWPSAELAIGDLDGDGDPDAAALAYSPLRVLTLENQDGAFIEAGETLYSGNAELIHIADLNNDHRGEIVVANFSVSPFSGGISVLANEGGFVFSEVNYPGTFSNPVDMLCADIDNDGDLDVACLCETLDDAFAGVAVFRNIGDSVLAPPTVYDTVVFAKALAAGDFNQDGAVDLAVGGGDPPFGNCLQVLFNRYPPCLGDLDGDRDIDQNDLGILLAAYEVDDSGDIDGDGVTGQPDLGLLLANFGRVCD